MIFRKPTLPSSFMIEYEKRLKTCVIAVAATILVAACASPINQRHAQNYMLAGYRAMEAGKWFQARMAFGRAVTDAELAGTAPRVKAILYYEYGRSSGVICDWPEAERGLKQAYGLDKESGGPAYMSLNELGRMNFDRQRYADALGYFDQVLPEFDRSQIDTRDPLGYSAFLDEYSITLEKTGRAADAERARKRALEIRSAFPGKDSQTDKTPYGTQCSSPSASPKS